MKINNSNQTSFRGTTQIYAISDSHQETRKTSAFLSKILDENHNNANVLFLNDGDIFKGIYPRELERDCYIKLKESKPDIEMVMTLGNNDFGFNKDSLDYLINTIKTFASKGIHTVCANIFDTSNMRPEWLKPYTIIERDGDKILVTGFCVNNINTGKFGLVPKKQSEVIDELNKAILEEQPDNIIVLNHDYLSSSKEIAKLCKDNGFNIDVIIGGHEHDFVPPDTNLNIYSPKSFSDSMYKMKLSNDNGQTTVSEVEMIENNGLKVSPIFENDIKAYETETKLYDNITPYTLNLTKKYSYPCPLGSFMADSMKEAAGTDLAFISTGFLTKPLEYRKDAYE